MTLESMRGRRHLGAGLLSGFAALLLASVLLPSLASAQQNPTPPPDEPTKPPATDAPAAAPTPPPAQAAPPPAPTDAAPADPNAAPAAPNDANAVPGDVTAEGSLDVGEPVSAEVIVTLDRRRKNLQDYSGTASAFTEQQLTSIGIRDVRDLAVTVPGLQIATQESGSAIFIRGVGSDNFTELGDPAVALHVDGVYMPRPRGLGQMFYDIARVEVNSGPQGTLRGRNAVGGSVNIVTNQPKFSEFQSMASATFGSYSLRSYQGMVNIPVGDTFALRVAGASMVHDSYWINAGPLYDIPGAQSADNYSLRATMKWQPIKPLEITVGGDYIAERGTGYLGAQFIDQLRRIDGPSPDGQAVPFDPNDYSSFSNPRSIYQRGWNPNVNLWHRGVRTDVTYDAGPVVFQFLGSYRDQDYKQSNTFPAGVILDQTDPQSTTFYMTGQTTPTVINPDIYSGNLWHNTSKATILELRAFAPDTARLRWAVGGFYFNEDQGAFLGQTRDPAGGYGGGEFNMPSTIGRSFAAYGDATFDITPDFRALAGIRYTHDFKSRTGGIWALWTNTGAAFNAPVDGVAQANPRFGTEGFQYLGFDRADYRVPDSTWSATDRVNWFFDGIKSFGARDEVPERLCNDPLPAEPGQPQIPRIAPDPNAGGHLRCTNGVRDNVPANIFNVVRQDYEVTSKYVDWRAGLEYDLAKDNLLYATVTTGHKAAGFNDTLFQGDKIFNSDYGPEKILSFELGSKNQLLDRKLKVNASAFAFTYTGMQFQTIVAVGDPPPRDMVTGAILIDPTTMMPYPDNRSGSAVRQNAKETTNVFGADIDFIYSLPVGLEAELHALLMDAKFSDGTLVNDTRLDPGARKAYVDLGGNWLPRTQAYVINFALSQLLLTEAAGTFDWVLQGQTKGKSYETVYNGDGKGLLKKAPICQGLQIDPANPTQCWDPAEDDDANYKATVIRPERLTDVVPVHTSVNIGAGWRHPDGRLSIRGYINNLFDVTYATYIGATGGGNLRFYNDQRTGGVTVRVDW